MLAYIYVSLNNAINMYIYLKGIVSVLIVIYSAQLLQNNNGTKRPRTSWDESSGDNGLFVSKGLGTKCL